MNQNVKIEAFKYVLMKLSEWKAEILNRSAESVSFSVTQELKLLFFVSAIKVGDSNLLDLFNKYYAMQFGPVESDVYNSITTSVLDISRAINISDSIRQRIDQSIEALRIASPSLVIKSASELVDISHRWECWRYSFMLAQALGKGSFRMSNELISQSEQFFK